MAKKPRIVAAGQSLHVVQRGNDRQSVFYAYEDYQRYLSFSKSAKYYRQFVETSISEFKQRFITMQVTRNQLTGNNYVC